MGYICSGIDCHKYFEGEPALSSPKGVKFCPKCHAKMSRRGRESMKRNIRVSDDGMPICIWCGEKVKPGSNYNEENYHKSCHTGRKWLKKCYINSDKPILYLASIKDDIEAMRKKRSDKNSAELAEVLKQMAELQERVKRLSK